jgi:type I restriction enzyme S subunit
MRIDKKPAPSKAKGLIPELRFPEFEEDGEWESKELREIFDSFSGGTPSTSVKGYYSGEIPFIRSAEIAKEKTELYLTEEGLNNSAAKLVNKGDLLIALYGANSGDVAISRINGAINQAILCMQSEYSNTFTYNFLSFKKDWIVSRYIQGGQGNLSGEIVKSIRLLFPKRQEQQKIAACLSSLDELITAHKDKLDALKDHKKGLLQNLFPSDTGGERSRTPKVRFSEFEGDGEWVEKKLGEMTKKVGSGKTPKGGDKNYKSSGRPFVRSQNIGWGILLLDDIAFIDEETHSSFPSSEIQLKDVLLNITGASIGRAAIANELIAKGNVNQHVCIIRAKNDLNPVFLNQYLISNYGQKQIDSFQAGGNRQGLNFNQIRSLKIPIPPTKKEQQKIASCLSAVDELITAQQEKIDQLQQHKKGLMQGLFPKINT